MVPQASRPVTRRRKLLAVTDRGYHIPMATTRGGAIMDDDANKHDSPADGRKRHRHGADRSSWPSPDQIKGTRRPTWSGKTMHHPAFRIGEIKHGKS
jgi:hypothetical protein